MRNVGNIKTMKNTLAALWIFAISSAYAQLDRAGNVIESDGDGMGFSLNGLVFPAIGAIVGLIATLVKSNLPVKPCVVIGAVAGFAVDIVIRAGG